MRPRQSSWSWLAGQARSNDTSRRRAGSSGSRARLRERLTRRGLALSAGLLTAGLSPQALSAMIPAASWDSTIQAAVHFAAGNAMTAGPVQKSVVALAEGVLQVMLWTKMRTAGLV